MNIARKQQVNIVDDSRDGADSLALLLKAMDYVVQVAYGAEAALKLAGESAPRLVFIDAAMPRTNGFELAKQLRKLPSMADAVLVCITGHGGAHYKRMAIEAGCNHFLLKPAEPDEVVRIAQRVARSN